MRNFVVHSNESVCRKSGLLGLEQVFSVFMIWGGVGQFWEQGWGKGWVQYQIPNILLPFPMPHTRTIMGNIVVVIVVDCSGD